VARERVGKADEHRRVGGVSFVFVLRAAAAVVHADAEDLLRPRKQALVLHIGEQVIGRLGGERAGFVESHLSDELSQV